MTSDDILQLLRVYYEERGYLCYGELRIGTGYGKNAEQRIDFWCINPMPASKLTRIACEIKISRSDWLRELKQPMKRRRALMLSEFFYIVAPVGIVKLDELPLEVGLIEVHDEVPLNIYQNDDRLHWKHPAPERDSIPPSWRFVAGLLRRDQQLGKVFEDYNRMYMQFPRLQAIETAARAHLKEWDGGDTMAHDSRAALRAALDGKE